MKYLKNFNDVYIYSKKWEEYLPNIITVIKGYDNEIIRQNFKKGNIMLNYDMLQITYESYPNKWGYPDTLEFDIYIEKVDNLIKFDVDITYGDEMVSEFAITYPNKVDIIQYTSYGSKFDPSNTVFALDYDTLKSLVIFFNKFGFELKIEDLLFLSENYEQGV